MAIEMKKSMFHYISFLETFLWAANITYAINV